MVFYQDLINALGMGAEVRTISFWFAMVLGIRLKHWIWSNGERSEDMHLSCLILLVKWPASSQVIPV